MVGVRARWGLLTSGVASDLTRVEGERVWLGSLVWHAYDWRWRRACSVVWRPVGLAIPATAAAGRPTSLT